MYRTLFSITILVTASFGASAQVPTATCPKPVNPGVYFPPDALRANFKGEVIVAVRFDDCGRVLEAELRKRSRFQSVNDIAVSSSKTMVLSEEQRLKAVDGWYLRVINFEGRDNPRSVKQKALDWPKSHSNPRYLQDDSAMGFGSVDAANKAINESDKNIVRPPVYQFVHRIVQVDAAGGREFWLFISSKGNTSVAARYRPVIEDGQAVVKLAMLCELEQSQCDGVRGLLMKGLPMAPAKP
jgi:hypothetical protein